MIKIKETIIVEGNYDKIKLSSLFDANIITTDGFGIYKDKETIALIKRLADLNGVIILTDSDSAGFRIRNFIRNHLKDKNVKNAFIPDINGKEKRKQIPAKEGLIGVEGMEKEILVDAFAHAGATFLDYSPALPQKKEPITKLDLYCLGLYGGMDSKTKRQQVIKKLGLPKKISSNLLIEVLNVITDKKELEKLAQDKTE